MNRRGDRILRDLDPLLLTWLTTCVQAVCSDYRPPRTGNLTHEEPQLTTIEPASTLHPLERSRSLAERAQSVLAGGVSSDARRTAGVPLCIDRGAGARLWDVDGNDYVDYVLGQGPEILGHSARRRSSPPSRSRLRAARLLRPARARGRGGGDDLRPRPVRRARPLQQRRLRGGACRVAPGAGVHRRREDPQVRGPLPRLARPGALQRPPAARRRPGPRTRRCPSRARAGSTPGSAEALVLPVERSDALGRMLDAATRARSRPSSSSRCCATPACIAPRPRLPRGGRGLCREHGALLIFDEVITGFRLAPGGAQEKLGRHSRPGRLRQGHGGRLSRSPCWRGRPSTWT